MGTAALLLAILAAAGIAVLDAAAARWTVTPPDGGTIWSDGVALLDAIAFRDASSLLLGAALMFAAALLLLPAATRAIGFGLLYVGAVQFASASIADLAGSFFGRLPPLQSLSDSWFAGGRSFPSPHVAFHAGLFFPLIALFPRWTPLLVLPPLFVAAARLLEHESHVSDVAASLALAALLAAVFVFIADKGRD